MMKGKIQQEYRPTAAAAAAVAAVAVAAVAVVVSVAVPLSFAIPSRPINGRIVRGELEANLPDHAGAGAALKHVAVVVVVAVPRVAALACHVRWHPSAWKPL